MLSFFFFLMIRRPPRSTQSRSSAASDVYKRQIQHHATDHFQGNQFFGNQLGRVQMIERKSVCFLLREKLNREFPFREITRSDGLEHIAAMEVLISAGNLNGLIPKGGLQTELWTPVEFDKG